MENIKYPDKDFYSMRDNVGATLAAIILAAAPLSSQMQQKQKLPPGATIVKEERVPPLQRPWENSERAKAINGIIDCLLAKTPAYLEGSGPSITLDESFVYEGRAFGIRIVMARTAMEASRRSILPDVGHLARELHLYGGPWYLQDTTGYGVALAKRFRGNYNHETGFKGLADEGGPILIPMFSRTQAESGLRLAAERTELRMLDIIHDYCRSSLNNGALESFTLSLGPLDAAIKAARKTS